MNVVRTLHETAMEFADRATISKAKGNPQDAMQFFQVAFELEKKATGEMPLRATDPLPRFIMLRSTAALAYKAGFFKEAEQIISGTLAENPPSFIVNELNEIVGLISQAKSVHYSNGHFSIKGKLTQANSSQGEITVEDMDRRQSFAIVVPKTLLDNIVKTYWHDLVLVETTNTPHGVFLLEKISRAA